MSTPSAQSGGRVVRMTTKHKSDTISEIRCATSRVSAAHLNSSMQNEHESEISFNRAALLMFRLRDEVMRGETEFHRSIKTKAVNTWQHWSEHMVNIKVSEIDVTQFFRFVSWRTPKLDSLKWNSYFREPSRLCCPRSDDDYDGFIARIYRVFGRHKPIYFVNEHPKASYLLARACTHLGPVKDRLQKEPLWGNQKLKRTGEINFADGHTPTLRGQAG